MIKGKKLKLITAVLIVFTLLAVDEVCEASKNTFILSKKIEVFDSRLLTVQFSGAKFPDTASGGYDKIKVYEGKNQLLQTINIADVNSFGDDFTTCPDPGTGSDIIIEDMDFDGINDFRIVAMLPPGPNIPYICFLWDKKLGKFVHADFLDDMTSPEFDSKAKLIISNNRESANKYTRDVYKYSNGRPLIIETVITEYKKLKDANGKLKLYEVKTTQKLINGKMKVTGIEKK
ncbi:MAG: hypothetical protein VB076_07555 [Synergistaceae bacterium]|jgi:hypothetical protein|nr:hypothetical protein [Synergistaceae bacterium]